VDALDRLHQVVRTMPVHKSWTGARAPSRATIHYLERPRTALRPGTHVQAG
jgi:hypothetical protein